MGIFLLLLFFSLPFNSPRCDFLSAVWIPNREVKTVESLPDLPSLFPLPALCCLCQSPKKRKRCSCQDFSGEERSPVGIPKKQLGNGLYRTSLTLHLSTRPAGLVEGVQGVRRRGRAASLAGGGCEGREGCAVPVWAGSLRTYLPTSPTPIPPFSQPSAPYGGLNHPIIVSFLLGLLQQDRVFCDLCI